MMFLTRLLGFGCLLLSAHAASAASPVNPTLNEAERGIQREDSESTNHLHIEELSVSAKVVGRTADVSLEMLLSSADADPYEAKLALSLPPNAVITGYALSVGKAMIAGQLLERPKARNVYEDEVRAGIDPGLAEISTGNQFTTRVYPIDAANPRRIRIDMSVPFDPSLGIVLPLNRSESIKKVAFNVVIDGYKAPPLIRFSGRSISLTRENQGWRGRVTKQNVTIEDLSINGGALALPMIVTRHSQGERFFVIGDSTEVATKANAGRLRIYWDRSLSHGGDNHSLELEVISELIATTSPTKIDLITFASNKPIVATFNDTGSLRKALSGVEYRGGTSLAGLDAISLPAAAQCVMVFDGKVTIDRATEFAPDCALSILTSSRTSDGTRLGRMAQSSAGQLVRVSEGRASEAAQALALRRPNITSVRDNTGKRIGFRALPAAQGHWQIVGPMPKNGGVRVKLNNGRDIDYSDPIKTIPSDAAGALWATQQVQALSDVPARHAEMVAVALRYGVAGPEMSLLVLERPDQYVRAGLTPPSGFAPDWTSEYREMKKDHDTEALSANRERFDFVLSQWKERQAWWNKRFVPRRPPPRPKNGSTPAPPSIQASMSPVTVMRAESSADAMSRLPPPPLPPPPPTSAPPAPSEGPLEVITLAASGRREVEPTPPSQRSSQRADIKLDLADITSKRPYIEALETASSTSRMTVLRAQEKIFGALPGFYLDTAEWFKAKGDRATSDLLLLSALELPLSDDETVQIVAFRLERDKFYDRAVELSEHLAAANANFRPQPNRDLALALAARGRAAGSAGRFDLERAFKILVDTALLPSSQAFDGFEVVALMEANQLTADIAAVGGSWELDSRLTGVLDTDVRIVMTWTADDADIDLWVDEPDGERVYYKNALSSAGGRISNDMTDGYGPEEYAIRRAPKGNYEIRVNGYDADRLNPNGAGHVLLRLIRNFARTDQRDSLVDLDLSFQTGRNRDTDDLAKPVATLTVEK